MQSNLADPITPLLATGALASAPPGAPRGPPPVRRVRRVRGLGVAGDVRAGDLVAAGREAGGSDLRSVRVFDVYRGEQLGAGRKSVGLAVAFQSMCRYGSPGT